MTFNYVSLFSGIGGFEQALNKLGGTCVMASEIDKYANQAYEVLYGHRTVGDVTKVDAADVPDHDLLVGGFPCQAFSVAGKRLGFDDTRGTLFFEIARIAKVKRPKALLLENGKGLVSHDKGRPLDVIVQTLNDIGYAVDFEVLNSKYFGVPQNRERIFIIAIRDDLITSEPYEIGSRKDVVARAKKRIGALAGVKTFNFDYPEQTEVTTSLKDILENEVDNQYYDSVYKDFFIKNSFNQEKKGNGFRFSPHVKQNAYISKTLTTKAGARMDDNFIIEGINSKKLIFTFDSKNIEYDPTLDYRIRKLTELETWRLQGFPDEAHQVILEAGLSSIQRYKMAGNAVTVNVIDAIARRLLPLL